MQGTLSDDNSVMLEVVRSLVAQFTTSSHTVWTAGQASVEAACLLYSDAACEVRMCQRDGSLLLVGGVGLPATYLQSWGSLPADRSSMVQRALRGRSTELTADSADLPPTEQELLVSAGARSRAVLPLVSNDQELGVFTIFLPYPHQWSEDEEARLRLLADMTAFALSHVLVAAREQRLQERHDDIFTSISHELRTPLTAVQGYLELTERKVQQQQVEGGVQQYLDIALRQSRVLSESIDHLLDAALLEQERLLLQPTSACPHTLFAATVEDLRHHFGQRAIDAELPATEREAVWDQLRVRQIVQHLVKNAVSYSNESAPVVLQLAYTEPSVQLVVRDYGVGIAPQDHARIFQRFWRGGSSSLARQSYGLGLGLYLSKGLAERHGGHLYVASEGVAGKGSTFTLELPWQTPTA